MSKELEKNYNPSEIEGRLYEKWEQNKYFHAEVDRSKKPFTIVMPPPNITGQLHMGHALDNTLQDILIRWRRMQGYDALWLPGTDHASIATEAKIVEAMKAEGITKDDLETEIPYTRVLAFSDRGRSLLRQAKKELSFVNTGERTDHPHWQLEQRCGSLYGLFCIPAPEKPGAEAEQRICYTK